MSKTGEFREHLSGERITRLIGVGDCMSALLAERHGFDALWSSSLAVSTAHGVPDAGILGMKEMLDAAALISRASRLPVVADCDTGFGDVNVVVRMVRQFEAAGIAAICIEDKSFPKRNSLRDVHELADMDEFAAKIAAGKQAQAGDDFMIIARLESFIAGHGLRSALERAAAYASAGADAILVHSKAKSPTEIEEFVTAWREGSHDLPLIVVPTTYPDVTGAWLEQVGVGGVIYANQTLRCALRAVDRTLAQIRTHDSTRGVEADVASVDEVFAVTGTPDIDALDRWFHDEVARRRDERAPALSTHDGVE